MNEETTVTIDPSLAWNKAWSIAPQDVEELWRTIGKLALLSGPKSRFVWRGMSSTDHLITSTLYRALQNQGIEPNERNHRANEAKMIADARSWGLGHTQYGQSSDLQLLAELQHHGFPTRLIDVTHNPLTALWFACEQNPDLPGRLVVMSVRNVEEVETSSTRGGGPTWGSMEDPTGWHYKNQLDNSMKDEVPFLVKPTILDARMTAQEGLFITAAVPNIYDGTPFPSLPTPKNGEVLLSIKTLLVELGFEEISNGWPAFGVLGLELTPDMKKQLLPALSQTFNRSARTMYPDMSGFVLRERELVEESLEEAATPED